MDRSTPSAFLASIITGGGCLHECYFEKNIMELPEQELSFIEKRRRMARNWIWIGSIMILVIVTFGVWSFWSQPMLFNPWFVLSQLKAEAFPKSTLILMAGILPVSMLMCLSLVLVIILLGFPSFSKEKKYISIIDKLISHHKEKNL